MIIRFLIACPKYSPDEIIAAPVHASDEEELMLNVEEVLEEWYEEFIEIYWDLYDTHHMSLKECKRDFRENVSDILETLRGH